MEQTMDASLNFQSIGDFKRSVNWGAEIVFEWNGKSYAIFSKMQKAPSLPVQKLIYEVDTDTHRKAEKWCDTADEVLEYMVGGDRLRDVITQVTVCDRTI